MAKKVKELEVRFNNGWADILADWEDYDEDYDDEEPSKRYVKVWYPNNEDVKTEDIDNYIDCFNVDGWSCEPETVVMPRGFWWDTQELKVCDTKGNHYKLEYIEDAEEDSVYATYDLGFWANRRWYNLTE